MAGRLPGRALAQLSRGGRSRLFATAPAASSSYANDMYAAWSRDPASVHPDWDAHFKGGGAAVSTDSPALSTSVTVAGQGVKETMGLLSLVTGYQTRGHNMADLDPLGIQVSPVSASPRHPHLITVCSSLAQSPGHLGCAAINNLMSGSSPPASGCVQPGHGTATATASWPVHMRRGVSARRNPVPCK